MINLNVKVSRKVIEDVCVTAIEGGSNYWYFLSEDAVKIIRNAVPKDEDPYLSTAIVKAVLDKGVAVPINDAENEDDMIGLFSKATLQGRLQKLYEDDNYRWALEKEMSEQGDGETSDIVFQYMTMGEVVYG
jgi:hypothetical protein